MKNLFITGEDKFSEKQESLAKSKGIKLFHLPLIKTKPLEYSFDQDIKYDYLIITSKKTLKYFNQVDKLDKNKPVLTTGKKTANILKSLGFKNIIIPQKQGAEGIRDYIISNNLIEKNFLFLRAKDGKNIDIPNIKLILVYETVINKPENKNILLENINKDTYIFFSSPSTFKSFKENFKNFKDILKIAKPIAIGKTTEKAIKKENIKVYFTPEKPSLEEVIKQL